jgi:putative ABC transport system substrate-binding protein
VTKTIPIVVATDDIIATGLVRSLSRPDGNTTGMSILAGELDGKRQEILIEAVPGVRRIAVLADSKGTAVAKLNEMQEAARARNIELSIHRIASGEEIAAALDTAQSNRSAALNVLASPLLWAYRRMIMDRAAALRLPAMYQWPEMAEEGGLAAYGPRIMDIGIELARQIDHVGLHRAGKRPFSGPIFLRVKADVWSLCNVDQVPDPLPRKGLFTRVQRGLTN